VLAGNLEVAVHKEIINDPPFLRFLDEKAASLARMLVGILAMVTQPPEDAQRSHSLSLGNRRFDPDKLTKAFREALDIHCRLKVAGPNFESTWHIPGSRFDPDNMTHAPDLALQGGSFVTVTVFPGYCELQRAPAGIPGQADCNAIQECRILCCAEVFVSDSAAAKT
jgi:hypothetical protein